MACRTATVNHPSEPLRAFIALPLPPEWTDELARMIAELRRAIPAGVRWVDHSGVHLTLKFLGPTEPGLVPRILDALNDRLGSAAAPGLCLSGLGTFPSGRNPRVIWAGVSGDHDALDALYRCAEAASVSLGWPPENRPFRPHLTLGRVRDRVSARQRRDIADAIAGAAPPAAPHWRPDRVRLYRSVLTPQGAVYSSLGEVKI